MGQREEECTRKLVHQVTVYEVKVDLDVPSHVRLRINIVCLENQQSRPQALTLTRARIQKQ